MAEGKSKPSLLAVGKQVAGAIWGGVTDPGTSTARKLDVLGGFLASGVRFAHATVIGKLGPRPEKRLVLWEFEGDAESRAVRETLSTLDLDADVRPCPEGGERFRPALQGAALPQLMDPNTGQTLNGAQAIVGHLYQQYGAKAAPGVVTSSPLSAMSGATIAALTGSRGKKVRPSKAPAQPLELYSFESSPYCRLAREALSELELPYHLHNVAKGSPRRKEFIARAGKMQVPWLYDPNTGTGLFESAAIEKYLQDTYGA